MEILREVGAVLENYVPRDVIEDSSKGVKHSGVSNLANRQSRPQVSLPPVQWIERDPGKEAELILW